MRAPVFVFVIAFIVGAQAGCEWYKNCGACVADSGCGWCSNDPLGVGSGTVASASETAASAQSGLNVGTLKNDGTAGEMKGVRGSANSQTGVEAGWLLNVRGQYVSVATLTAASPTQATLPATHAVNFEGTGYVASPYFGQDSDGADRNKMLIGVHKTKFTTELKATYTVTPYNQGTYTVSSVQSDTQATMSTSWSGNHNNIEFQIGNIPLSGKISFPDTSKQDVYGSWPPNPSKFTTELKDGYTIKCASGAACGDNDVRVKRIYNDQHMYVDPRFTKSFAENAFVIATGPRGTGLTTGTSGSTRLEGSDPCKTSNSEACYENTRFLTELRANDHIHINKDRSGTVLKGIVKTISDDAHLMLKADLSDTLGTTSKFKIKTFHSSPYTYARRPDGGLSTTAVTSTTVIGDGATTFTKNLMAGYSIILKVPNVGQISPGTGPTAGYEKRTVVKIDSATQLTVDAPFTNPFDVVAYNYESCPSLTYENFDLRTENGHGLLTTDGINHVYDNVQYSMIRTLSDVDDSDTDKAAMFVRHLKVGYTLTMDGTTRTITKLVDNTLLHVDRAFKENVQHKDFSYRYSVRKTGDFHMHWKPEVAKGDYAEVLVATDADIYSRNRMATANAWGLMARLDDFALEVPTEVAEDPPKVSNWITFLRLTATTGITCSLITTGQALFCRGLTLDADGKTLSKGSSPYSLGSVSHVAMASLSLSNTNKAIVCYNDGGKLKCSTLVHGGSDVNEDTDAIVEVTDYATTAVSMASMSATTVMLCWAGSGSAGNSKGFCNLITYKGSSTPLVAGTPVAIDVDGAPTVTSVTGFSSTKGMACWYRTTTPGKCMALSVASTQVTAPGSALTVSAGAVTALATATFDATNALACFNEGGSNLVCLAIQFNAGTSALTAGSHLVVQAASKGSTTVATFGPTTAAVCYVAPNDSAKCNFLTLGSNLLTMSIAGTFYESTSGTLLLSLGPFSSSTNILCYQDASIFVQCVVLAVPTRVLQDKYLQYPPVCYNTGRCVPTSSHSLVGVERYIGAVTPTSANGKAVVELLREPKGYQADQFFTLCKPMCTVTVSVNDGGVKFSETYRVFEIVGDKADGKVKTTAEFSSKFYSNSKMYTARVRYVTGTGTVSTTDASATVTGASKETKTKFNSEFAKGWTITIVEETKQIEDVISDTRLTTTQTFVKSYDKVDYSIGMIPALGSVTNSQNSKILDGDENTRFLEQLKVGYTITASEETHTITAITSNKLMTIDTAFTAPGITAPASYKFSGKKGTGEVSVDISSSTTRVDGTSDVTQTQFQNELSLGYMFMIGHDYKVITKISSNTLLEVDSIFENAGGGNSEYFSNDYNYESCWLSRGVEGGFLEDDEAYTNKKVYVEGACEIKPGCCGFKLSSVVYPDRFAYYKIRPPHTNMNIRVIVKTTEDNVDLVVKKSARPTTSSYDYKSVRESNPWALTVPQDKITCGAFIGGTQKMVPSNCDYWYIGVRGDNRYPQKTGASEYDLYVYTEFDWPNFLCSDAKSDQGTNKCKWLGISKNEDTNMVTNDDSQAVMRLTPAINQCKGSMFYSTKLHLYDGFETTFQFRMTGFSVGCNSVLYPSGFCGGGDGFAFVIQKEDDRQIGCTGAGLGYATTVASKQGNDWARHRCTTMGSSSSSTCDGASSVEDGTFDESCSEGALCMVTGDNNGGCGIGGICGFQDCSSTMNMLVAVEFDTWNNLKLHDPKQGVSRWWINATEFVGYNDNHVAIFASNSNMQSDHALNEHFAATPSIPNLADGKSHTVKIKYWPQLNDPGREHDGTYNRTNWKLRGKLHTNNIVACGDCQDTSKNPAPDSCYNCKKQNNKPGNFAVFIDDMKRPVLQTAISLRKGVAGMCHDDNRDRCVLDESGNAYIGFTAATGGERAHGRLNNGDHVPYVKASGHAAAALENAGKMLGAAQNHEILNWKFCNQIGCVPI